MAREPRHDDSRDSEAQQGVEFSAQAVLDGLSSHIAIVDGQGRIESVNKAWREFAEANSPACGDVCEGANYIEQCDLVQGEDAECARRAADAIRNVLAGRVDTFTLEYPCHSPTVRRWFAMRITRYPGAGPPRAIVVHDDTTERKLAEEALRASQERFRDLTERTSDWVWEVDEHGVYTYASPRVRDLLGYEPDEVVGKTPFDFMPEDEAARTRDALHMFASQRAEIKLLENTLVRRDGTTVVVETSGVPILDESGAFRGYRGIDRDITERKRIEEELRAGEQRFRDLVRNLSSGVVVHDGGGRIVLANEMASAMLGMSEEQMLGKTADDPAWRFVHEDGTPMAVEEYPVSQVMSSGRTLSGLIVGVRHPDPSEPGWLLCNAYPVLGPGGDLQQVVVTFMDITGRKRAEAALRRSEDKFRSIVETTGEWIWEVDPQGRHTYSNPTVEDILGYRPEEIVGSNVFALMHEEDRETARRVLEESAANARGWSDLIVRWRGKDGAYRWLESNAVPVLDDSGKVVAFRGADRDITERRRAEEALALAAQRDRHIAYVLQQTLIPPQVPMQPAGYEIAARYQPALREAEVCGDFYDLIDLGDGKIGIVIGDLVGKGLCAATGIAAVRQTIRSYALLGNAPSSVAALLNDALSRDTALDQDMLTAFVALLDTQAGTLAYANAGHEPPLLRHADGSIEPLTEAPGPMLSGIGDQAFPECSLDLRAGDLMVLVTDGITEARIADTLDFFGTKGIERCLAHNAGAPAEHIAAALLADATAFAGGELRDDAAIVVIRKLEGSGEEGRRLLPRTAGGPGTTSEEEYADD